MDTRRPLTVCVLLPSDSRTAEDGVAQKSSVNESAKIVLVRIEDFKKRKPATNPAQCVKATAIRKAMRTSASLRGLFLNYVQTFMVQTAYTAIANGRGKIEERLARWLLMAHDRIETATLPLTHELIALMLGVRRAGVTDALTILQRRGLIGLMRGKIVVLNRTGLERYAGGYYGIPEAEQRRLLG